MLSKLCLLLAGYLAVSAYRCSNRLYRGQFLYPGEYLCSRSLNYRLYFTSAGQVVITEAFPRENYLKLPSPILFTSPNSTVTPKYLTLSDNGDLQAVAVDGTVYWRANVTGGDLVEMQDNGIAVIFSAAGGYSVLWKSLSMYSLRLVGGSNQGRLDILYNNTWGSVCNTTFDSWEATTACRTMGYTSGQVISNTFGASTGPIWMTNVKCINAEDMFQDCPFNADLKFWGDTTCTHAQDVAIQCLGTWTLGVMAPVSHVCLDRLAVGKTLSLGQSLCGGLNGEFALRFTINRGDTIIVFENKRKRKWALGVTGQSVTDASLRLDSDGVVRINGTGAGLPLALFASGGGNASFMELQDNGVARVVNTSGITGWRTSPNDSCYEEIPRAGDQYNTYEAVLSSISLKACIERCNTISACRTVYYSEFSEGACTRGVRCCVSKNDDMLRPLAFWTHYERISGCLSGAGCYTVYPSTALYGFDLNAGATGITLAACIQQCDTISPPCLSFAYYDPGNLPASECHTKWRRWKDSWINGELDTYHRSVPCTAIAPQDVPVLPSKTCATKLYKNSYLLPGEQLCSQNGQHAFAVEKDGRLSINAGQWYSGSSAASSGLLQFTDKLKLLLRLDNGSIIWQAEATYGGSSCYLAISDTGVLQIITGTSVVIWNHVNGTLLSGIRYPVNSAPPAAEQAIDGNNASCTWNIPTIVLSVSTMPFNTSFGMTIVGQYMQCAVAMGSPGFQLVMPIQFFGADHWAPNGRFRPCQLVSGTETLCSYQCTCPLDTCEAVTLCLSACSDSTSQICEIFIH